jgi:NAD-dependent DNA ligase
MRDQELLNQFNGRRIEARQVDELIGLSRGLTADGVINQMEAEFLVGWLAANAGAIDNPVITHLYRHIGGVLADGVLDKEEAADLLSTLEAFTGGNIEIGESLKSTTLPLCDPAPDIQFENQNFCLTGTFNFGGRHQCQLEIIARGGCCGSLTKKTNFLVIGGYATESWKHSTFGLKVIKAVEMKDSGVPIAIVSEEHWRAFL